MKRLKAADRLLLAMAAAFFAMQMAPHLLDLPYGFFIDELYFIACSKRLALGYVDHPPLSMLLLRLIRVLFGDSLVAIRFFPALAGAAAVFLTGWIARRLGAGLYGQGLAALLIMTSPIMALFFGFYSMNSFGLLIWTGCLALTIAWKLTGNPRLWIWFGALLGVGLLNKHTIVMLGVCLAAGLLLTEDRKILLNGWAWAGAGLALLLVLPNLWWQVENGWPSLEFYRNAALLKNLEIPPHEVLILQLLFINLGGVVVWVASLVFFHRGVGGTRFRFLTVAYLALLLMAMFSGQSRPDRLAGFYPILFAAGSVFWERISAGQGRRWLRWAVPGMVLVPSLLLFPLGYPVAPPDAVARYAVSLGVVPQIERGPGKVTQLPQWFADRLGWEKLVDDVTRVVDRLSPEERRQAAILAPSYGQAGALELLGKNLPPVRGTQNNYHLWGRGLGWPPVLVTVSWNAESLLRVYSNVEEAGIHDCDFCMPWRDNAPILVARGPKQLDYDRIWEQMRNYQ